VVYRIKAHEHRLADALIEANRLSADQALRRQLVEAGTVTRDAAPPG